jgi:hypothetical protein
VKFLGLLPRQVRQRLGSVPPGQLDCWAILFFLLFWFWRYSEYEVSSFVNGGLDIGPRE